MEKEKKEKIILLILLPIFAIGLIVRVVGMAQEKNRTLAKTIEIAESFEGSESLKPQGKKLQDIKNNFRKVVYDGKKFTDPLKDKYLKYIAKKTKIDSKFAGRKTEPPQLVVTGLIWNSDMPQAIVNGQVLTIGGKIEGARLLSVNKNGVNVEYEGLEFFIDKNTQSIAKPKKYRRNVR